MLKHNLLPSVTGVASYNSHPYFSLPAKAGSHVQR
jgi:hypothetical protein